MLILGLNKTTLLDYPGFVAATLFTGGCNFRCPYCHNRDLVLKDQSLVPLSEEEIFAFLQKRRNVLTGVCITGGEPTLYPDLPEFISQIRELGYLVKLDTNGYCPEVIRKLTEKGLVDYIAMDIKNDLKKYGETVGIQGIDAGRIMDSIRWIINGKMDYEFRTTVVKELHGREDMSAIGKAIKGAKAYFLQGYQESGGVIAPGFHAYGKEEMEELAEWVKPFVPNVQLRGVE